MKKLFTLWEDFYSICSLINTKVMRCIMFLMLITVVQAYAENSYSQDTRLSMELNDVTVQDVLDEIESQSEFFFLFNRKLVDVDRKVDVSFESKDINEILAQVFQGSDVGYIVLDRQIVLSTAEHLSSTKTVLQQGRTVAGLVIGEDGEPLIGVSISIKGTTVGTITDLDGNYSLSDVPDDATLVFSFIGMVTQEIFVGNQTSINVTMEPDVLGLEEVVVVGYGTQRKIDLTGSISTVKSEDIAVVPVTRLDQALQGRAAGVLMRQNSFDPGPGSISLIIRGLNSINGTNSPLFVVDGVIGGDINSLDPLDIESIDVLKDASAASIYGSRAANGVVLVTTKKGFVGQAKVTFDAYYGISQNTRPYDVMNPQQYMEYVNDVRTQDGIELSYPDIPGVLRQVGDGTDWQDELFGTGSQQKYFLSVSGGTEAITYSASGGYLKTTGLMPNVDYSKYTARFNVDFKATDFLKFFTGINYAKSVQNSMNSTWDGRSGTINVIATPPMLSPTDEFGDYPPILYNTYETGTPRYYYNSFAALDKEIHESLGSYIQLNLGAEVQFTDWLKYRVSLGLQPSITEGRFFRPSDIPEAQYFTLQPTASKSSSRSDNWLVENMLTFEKSFNDSHNVTVLAGTSTQKFRYESTNAGTANFVFDQYQFHNLGAGVQANHSVGSSLSEQQLQSFFGRINYNFKGKYFLQVNGRYDGSSKFAPGNQWAFFPSASVGWRLSEESFMDGSVFDNMKLRASYGSIGSHGINPYATQSLIGPTFSYGFNDVRVGTYMPTGIANKDLKWETTTQLDIGLDLGLLQHRLNVTLDYYHKKTTDLLLNQLITLVNNPSTNHNPSITKNIGALQNTGFEFGIGYRSVAASDFTWSVDLNGTFQQNKILDLALAEGQESLLLGDNLRRNYQILQEGEPFGDYVGYVTDGLYQNQGEIDGSAQPASKPGDMKYVDQNQDGVINHDDFKVLGNAYPDFFGGLTANLGYKSFNLSIFLFSMLGQEIFNFELAQWKYDLSSTQFNKFAEVATDRWTGPGTSDDIPRAGYKPVNITDGADGGIDKMVEDASFLKLRNVTLSYDLPKAFLSKISMSNANVYIQGNNLLTLTKYTGMDPEANQMGGSVITLPLNSGYYPATRTFMIGLQIGF
jgi:TonB-linked SusC/RagA family outer membrane protein